MHGFLRGAFRKLIGDAVPYMLVGGMLFGRFRDVSREAFVILRQYVHRQEGNAQKQAQHQRKDPFFHAITSHHTVFHT